MMTGCEISKRNVLKTDPYVSTKKRRLDIYGSGSFSNKRTKLEQVLEAKVVEEKQQQQKQLATVTTKSTPYVGQPDKLCSLFQDPVFELPFHLSEYAIHCYNMDQYAGSCFTLKQDGFYGNVNLVHSSIESSSANNIKTCIVFKAVLPADKTTQTFITKISMSFSDPPLSTVKIGFRSVKIKGEESDYEDIDDDDEEEEEEEQVDDLSEDDPEIYSGSDVEDHSQKSPLEDSKSDVEDHSQIIPLEDSIAVIEDHSKKMLLEFQKKLNQEILSRLGDGVYGESLSESDDKHSKDSEFFEYDDKLSKDYQESLSKSDEKLSKDSKENISEIDERCSKDSEENLSKFCEGEPSKDSGENLSKFDNAKHSEENLSESEEKDTKTGVTKTGVRYYCHADTHFTPMEEKYKGSELSKEIKSFRSDVAKSDGFEVGHYPLMDAAGIHGTWIFKFYDLENKPCGPNDMNELVCLSRLAICIYNMDKNTRFGNVKVLKAMTFAARGGSGCNITFEASLTDKTTEIFRTRIFTNIPFPYEKIEIEFVKVKPN